MRFVLLAGGSWFEFIQPFQDPVFRALRHWRHGVILIKQSQIITNLFALLVHAAQAVRDDHRDFIGERRVVREQVWNGASEEMAVTILVLQTFAVEGGAPGG